MSDASSTGKNVGDLKQLEYLSLVSKVCAELENHLGISDRDLAEFLVSLAMQENVRTTADFIAVLKKNDAEIVIPFAESLFVLIRRMMPAPATSKKFASSSSAGDTAAAASAAESSSDAKSARREEDERGFQIHIR